MVRRDAGLSGLREAPITVPALAATAVMAWWAVGKGGFAVSSWAPGGLALLGLLLVAALAIPGTWSTAPRTVVLAAAALAAYTLWSVASIGWADDPGFAFQGAGRTLLYLVAFCLFALWPQRGPTAAWVLGGVITALGLAAVVTVGRLAGDPTGTALLGTGRLSAPTGYPNATAALMLMGFFPAVVLAATSQIPWWVRGALAALAVLFASLALLTVSRGATFSTPVVLVLLFLLVPGRIRHGLTLVPVALALGLCVRRLLHVGDVADANGDVAFAAHRALEQVAPAALLTGLAVAWIAAVTARRPPGPATARRLQLAGRVGGAAVILGLLIGGLAVAGNPADRVTSAWASFKGGYSDNDSHRNRLVSGLGSNRYDFYRVALRSFRAHPVAGVGADNFYQAYLREGRSTETPRYPHSLELRTLAQTGAVGALLLLTAFGAAVLAAMRAMRGGDPLGRAVAGAAMIGGVTWLVHGSVDWFWEWAGLGVPAFALLGLAGSLAPRRERQGAPSVARPAPAGLLVLAGVVLAVPFASLWLADRSQRRATAAFPERPRVSYGLLDRAGALDPFSASPATLEGSIALRLNDLPRADAAFGRALRRVPDDAYATLEAGAVASALGDAAQARRLLERALVLAPRDVLTREALGVVRQGGRVDVTELNRRILAAARRLAG